MRRSAYAWPSTPEIALATCACAKGGRQGMSSRASGRTHAAAVQERAQLRHACIAPSCQQSWLPARLRGDAQRRGRHLRRRAGHVLQGVERVVPAHNGGHPQVALRLWVGLCLQGELMSGSAARASVQGVEGSRSARASSRAAGQGGQRRPGPARAPGSGSCGAAAPPAAAPTQRPPPSACAPALQSTEPPCGCRRGAGRARARRRARRRSRRRARLPSLAAAARRRPCCRCLQVRRRQPPGPQR